MAAIDRFSGEQCMSFRYAGFRPAALGCAALIFALASGTSLAQAATAASAPAPAGTAAPAAAPATIPAAEAAAVKPGDATAGQAKAAACGACHGSLDNKTGSPCLRASRLFT